MGWERRGDRVYYYRAARVGGRVVKEYIPPLVADATAAIADDRRALRAFEADSLRRARDELDALADALAPLDALAEALTRGAMAAAGYHQHHRGEWRRRRDRA